MQNSSKKSLRPSPSQPDKGKQGGGKSKPGVPAPGMSSSQMGSQMGSQPAQQNSGMAPGRPISQEQVFGSSGGKRLRIPVGRGFSVTLEGRQFGLLILSAVLYIFAAFVASEWI